MQNFAELVDLALGDGKQSLRPVVEKELLHYDILFALEKERFLQDLTFQGGTALRLCYGGKRLSEDLDFVGGVDFCPNKVRELRECVLDYIGRRYGLEVAVKNPREMREEPAYWGLQVDRWQISVTTNPGQRDLPRQRIKLEVANVPAHTRTARPLQRNYDFLPVGYGDLLVPVETKDEILADKIVALVSCRDRVRHRDIWDIVWLRRHHAQLRPDLVSLKVQDYRAEDYEGALAARIADVAEIARSDPFREEMTRFLDPATRSTTFDKPGFTEFVGEDTREVLLRAQDALYPARQELPFEF